MSFETHITLSTANGDALIAAHRWAHRQSLKWTQIELHSGETPTQPMISFWGKDSLDAQLRRAGVIKQDLENLQVQVVRIKVETEFPGPFVPAAGCTEPANSNQYFECHVKLRLHSPQDL